MSQSDVSDAGARLFDVTVCQTTYEMTGTGKRRIEKKAAKPRNKVFSDVDLTSIAHRELLEFVVEAFSSDTIQLTLKKKKTCTISYQLLTGRKTAIKYVLPSSH
jgi:hypothetical protein